MTLQLYLTWKFIGSALKRWSQIRNILGRGVKKCNFQMLYISSLVSYAMLLLITRAELFMDLHETLNLTEQISIVFFFNMGRR